MKKHVKSLRSTDLAFLGLSSFVFFALLILLIWSTLFGELYPAPSTILVSILLSLGSVAFPLVYFYKRRCLYDPKLATIRVNNLEGMRLYKNILFTVIPNVNQTSGLNLLHEHERPEHTIRIFFSPNDIDHSVWVDQINSFEGYVQGIRFTENGDNSMTYSFYSLECKKEYTRTVTVLVKEKT